MDVSDLEKKWTEEAKKIKKDHPVKTDVLSEVEGVLGALARLGQLWGEAEKATELLRKKFVPVIAAAEKAAGEVAGFVKVAKAAKADTLIGEVTDGELEDFIKDAKLFKTALAKFEKSTD